MYKRQGYGTYADIRIKNCSAHKHASVSASCVVKLSPQNAHLTGVGPVTRSIIWNKCLSISKTKYNKGFYWNIRIHVRCYKKI